MYSGRDSVLTTASLENGVAITNPIAESGLNKISKMRLRIPARPYEINEARLACLKFNIRQSASKQLMAEP
jgi:hypothetical protein